MQYYHKWSAFIVKTSKNKGGRLIQKYTSASTSINQVTALYKRGLLPEKSVVLDYGGGKFDKNIQYMKQYNVDVKVYDPFNRSEDHNSSVLNYFEKNPAKFVVCANVLNVIEDDNDIFGILSNIKRYIDADATIYVQVYERNRSGVGEVTKRDCWQRNQKTSEYLPLIKKIFPDFQIQARKKIITIKREEK